MFRYFAELIRKTSQEKRWQDVLVEAPDGKTLTKEDLYRYYMHPKVQKELLEQFGDRPVTVVHKYESAHPVLKRHRPEDGKFIRIRHGKKDPDDPESYLYWVTRRTVEFHPTFGKTVDAYWVDLDPRSDFSFERTKGVAKSVGDALSKREEVKGVEYIYSGGRGIYVKANLKKPVDVDAARKTLKSALSPMASEKVMFEIPSSHDSLRMDIGTLKHMGSLRAAWSINANTGRVAVPIKDLKSFKPEQATVEKVLGGKPSPAKVYRP